MTIIYVVVIMGSWNLVWFLFGRICERSYLQRQLAAMNEPAKGDVAPKAAT